MAKRIGKQGEGGGGGGGETGSKSRSKAGAKNGAEIARELSGAKIRETPAEDRVASQGAQGREGAKAKLQNPRVSLSATLKATGGGGGSERGSEERGAIAAGAEAKAGFKKRGKAGFRGFKKRGGLKGRKAKSFAKQLRLNLNTGATDVSPLSQSMYAMNKAFARSADTGTGSKPNGGGANLLQLAPTPSLGGLAPGTSTSSLTIPPTPGVGDSGVGVSTGAGAGAGAVAGTGSGASDMPPAMLRSLLNSALMATTPTGGIVLSPMGRDVPMNGISSGGLGVGDGGSVGLAIPMSTTNAGVGGGVGSDGGGGGGGRVVRARERERHDDGGASSEAVSLPSGSPVDDTDLFHQDPSFASFAAEAGWAAQDADFADAMFVPGTPVAADSKGNSSTLQKPGGKFVVVAKWCCNPS